MSRMVPFTKWSRSIRWFIDFVGTCKLVKMEVHKLNKRNIQEFLPSVVHHLGDLTRVKPGEINVTFFSYGRWEVVSWSSPKSLSRLGCSSYPNNDKCSEKGTHPTKTFLILHITKVEKFTRVYGVLFYVITWTKDIYPVKFRKKRKQDSSNGSQY